MTVSLRKVIETDKDLLHSWRNQDHVRYNMYTSHKISLEEHYAWFDAVMSDETKIFWIIQCDGEDIGLVNLYDIDFDQSECCWAFYIGRQDQTGKGIGSSVETQILNYVFHDLKLAKLKCEVLAFNEGVIYLHKKFGFKQTGIVEARVERDGAPVDALCFEVLAEDWARSSLAS